MERSQIQMTGVCPSVCVVGPGFDSTFPAFVRGRASQAAGSDGWLAKKRNRAPISGCVDTICADFCSSPTSCRLCLLGPRHCHRHVFLLLYNYLQNSSKVIMTTII